MGALSKKDRAADQRLIRVYGITLADYNRMLKEQGGRCAICRRPPKRLRLAVDHNHAVERTKIKVQMDAPGYWFAEALDFSAWCETKAEAVRQIKRALMRRSVRGLLCMICNKRVLGAMERFKVRPDAVRAYLEKYDHNNPLIQPGVDG